MSCLTVVPAEQPRTEFIRTSSLGLLAKRVLIDEAELTPKPGLVDRRGSGSHSDLSLDLMRHSAETLGPHFQLMADVAGQLPLGQLLRERLGAIGRDAEEEMYRATGGVNTHKGAIWAIGLLVAAASQGGASAPYQIARLAGDIARIADRWRPDSMTHGSVVRARYGISGAYAEARAGFPHVIDIGLPVLREARMNGKSERDSRLSALLYIMSTLNDTCVLYRSGLDGAGIVKDGAEAVLAAGGPGTVNGDRQLSQLDQDLVARNISPGGSADLLAATLFLDALESGEAEAGGTHTLHEDPYGTN